MPSVAAQAHLLGRVRGVQHLGSVLVRAAPLDPLLLRAEAGLPRVVLPPADPGMHVFCVCRVCLSEAGVGNSRCR